MNYNTRVREAFDRWSKTYEQEAIEKICLRGYDYNTLSKMIASFIPGKDCFVLELGTGSGLVGALVRACFEGIHLTGVDISPEMIMLSEQKGVYDRLLCLSADEYLEDKRYDLIYSSFMFHSVENQVKLINNIKTMLVPGGRFLIVDLFPNVRIKKEKSTLEHSMQHEYGAPSNYLTLNEMVKLAEDSGLYIEEVAMVGEKREYNHYFVVLQGDCL